MSTESTGCYDGDQMLSNQCCFTFKGGVAFSSHDDLCVRDSADVETRRKSCEK